MPISLYHMLSNVSNLSCVSLNINQFNYTFIRLHLASHYVYTVYIPNRVKNFIPIHGYEW